MTDVKILASGFGFPEGPVVMPDGAVILTEIRNGRCSRVTPDGKSSVFSECGGGPNGLAIGPDGALYLCNNGGSPLCRGHVDGPRGRIPTTRAARSSGSMRRRARPRRSTPSATATGSRAPNDLVFDKQGGFYFTDLGKRHARHRDHGGLYYALPDGSKITCIAYPILSPNGCGLSPDGKTLYVAETEGARLWAFDIEGPGVLQEAAPSPSQRARARRRTGPPRFDSLAVLENGNICVATLTTGKITEISPTGAVVREVKMPDIYPTNICFGGTDRRTAYITLSDKGRLGVMQWPTPGLKLNF